jgi:hypothetical protein
VKQNAYRLLAVSPPLIIVYLSRREDRDQCLQVWHAVLSGIVRHPECLHSNLASLLNASCNAALPNYLKPKANELDALVEASLTDVLSGSAPTGKVSLLSRLLASPGEYQSMMLVFVHSATSCLRQATFFLTVDFIQCCIQSSPPLHVRSTMGFAIQPSRYQILCHL